jgi:hypothetical protein
MSILDYRDKAVDSVHGTEGLLDHWKTTTQTNGVWDSPVYADFFAAVREVNKKLPANARIRVLAGDPPRGSGMDRDASAVSILKEQVIEKHGKALVIYGAGHLFQAFPRSVTGITNALDADYPGRTFVVITQGGPYAEYDKFEGALKTWVRPVLVSLGRSPFRDFTAEEFLGRGNKRLVNGEWVNAYQGSRLTLGQMADAYIYLGSTSGADLRLSPDRQTGSRKVRKIDCSILSAHNAVHTVQDREMYPCWLSLHNGPIVRQ